MPDLTVIDQAREWLAPWVWVGPLRWTAPLFAAAALWASTSRRSSVLPLLATAATAAAAWGAGPLAAAAAVALAAMSVPRARRDRWVDRAHRGAVTAAVALAAVFSAHLWAVDTTPAGWAAWAAAVFAAVVVLTLVRPKPPATDSQRMFTPAQRAEIIRRDGNWCGYCGAPGDGPGVQLAVDHVVAHSRGGRTHVDNAKMACTPCNASKGSLTWNEWVRKFRREHGFNPGEFAKPGLFARMFSR